MPDDEQEELQMGRELRVPETNALRSAAADVLGRNDLGTATKAAGGLYPHQWSWDSAFMAIGWARLDIDRAQSELRSLLAAQRDNGRLPHIVINPQAPPGSYWPSPRHWSCRDPHKTRACCAGSSGLCQPPTHAIAAQRIWSVARQRGGDAAQRAREFLVESFPKLLAWHRYLATARDPERSGLVTIYHPWESGMDNSPRWDEALARVTPPRRATFERVDLARVGDSRERPTDAEYQRYWWLVKLLRDHCYDDEAAYRSHPFLVKDVFASALLVAANLALLEIAQTIDAPAQTREMIARWVERGRSGLNRSWSRSLGLALDLDLRSGRWLRVRTAAGFAPLIAGIGDGLRRQILLRTLQSSVFLGHSRLRWPLPPSTSPRDMAFQPRAYWRGPVWPVMNWLLWWSLKRLDRHDLAACIRRASLKQVAATGVFPEYVEPFTGEPLGAPDQSWTAAVVLDWLATAEDPAPPPARVNAATWLPACRWPGGRDRRAAEGAQLTRG